MEKQTILRQLETDIPGFNLTTALKKVIPNTKVNVKRFKEEGIKKISQAGKTYERLKQIQQQTAQQLENLQSADLTPALIQQLENRIPGFHFYILLRNKIPLSRLQKLKENRVKKISPDEQQLIHTALLEFKQAVNLHLGPLTSWEQLIQR